MSVNITPSSRLLFADLFTADGAEFWDTLVLPDSVPQPDDLQYKVMGSDRIDQIAYKFYQDPGFWWVIAWANNLEILPTDLKENMVLRIPSKDFVSNQLTKAIRGN